MELQPFREFLEERAWYNELAGRVLRKIRSKDYKHALQTLIDVIDRKRRRNQLRHGVEYYAKQIADTYANVNGFDLADLYIDSFGEVNESIPVTERVDQWISANEKEAKEEYGDKWETYLHETAYLLFVESLNTIDQDESINEESAAPTTTTSGVANPDAKPVFKKEKFLGHECIEVDENTYAECIKGKMPFKRWKKYVGDESLRGEMKKMYKKNKRMLIKDSKSGAMVFIK